MIDAEVGGATATSYVTLAEAEAYFATRVNAEAWNAATPMVKEQALLTAARALERLRWHGQRAWESQALCWPRRGAAGAEDGTVPPAIRQAQCEEALAWLSPEVTRRRRLRDLGVVTAQAGAGRETFRPAGTLELYSPAARALVTGWVRWSGQLVTDRAEEA